MHTLYLGSITPFCNIKMWWNATKIKFNKFIFIHKISSIVKLYEKHVFVNSQQKAPFMKNCFKLNLSLVIQSKYCSPFIPTFYIISIFMWLLCILCSKLIKAAIHFLVYCWFEFINVYLYVLFWNRHIDILNSPSKVCYQIWSYLT